MTIERVSIGRRSNWFWEHLAAAHVARYLFAAERLPPGAVVVDVGCGTGYGPALLAADRRRVTGVDNNTDAVAFAQANWAGPGVTFAVADMRQLPFPDASVDAIVALESIEHVVDPETALGEWARALRKGGALVVSTPERAVYDTSISEPNPFHHRELSAEELRAALAPAFEIVEEAVQLRAISASLAAQPQAHSRLAPSRGLKALAKPIVKAISGPFLSRPAVARIAFPLLRRRFQPRPRTEGEWLYIIAVGRRG